MKKVLALVLAVVMVCTMAMAVNVGGTTTATNPTSTYQYSTVVYPGQSIIFDKDDLATGLVDKDIEDGKINVTVAFERGADKIASKGWVKDNNVWKYVLTTKEGVVAADGTPDIIIASIVVTKTGVYAPLKEMKFTKTETDGTVKYAYIAKADPVIPSMEHTNFETLKHIATEANSKTLSLGFDYGYLSSDIVIAADGLSVTPSTFVEGTIYTVKRADVANAKPSIVLGKDVTATATPFTYSYTLKAGETVMYTNIGTLPAANSAAEKALRKNLLDHDAVIVENKALENEMMPSKAVTLSYDNAKDGYKMYMVKADGSVVDLNAKFNDNKVLTATATLTGPVIVTDKALTAVGTTTPGTTTNPGTGANDVVGVAAALAVVALVSGAAISLKK